MPKLVILQQLAPNQDPKSSSNQLRDSIPDHRNTEKQTEAMQVNKEPSTQTLN